ncbi:hypothetical protein F4802DRAFT_29881 [Xylaria palmicola]|nr:hypothetical protein F4802DRAFT_29881 [Xylaria palmicola]
MEQHYETHAVWSAATHDLDFAMQEYLLLQDQHEELSQRLHQLSPPSTSSAATTTLSLAPTTVTTSPSVSPTRSSLSREGSSPSKLSPSWGRRRTSQTWTSGPDHHRAARLDPRGPAQDGSLVGAVAAGEQKLFDVNEELKRALTELLNCEAVRRDGAMRTWVQTRLLETEKELRRGRRRRSSATVD